MGYGRKETGPSQVPKRRGAMQENSSYGKGKQPTLPEASYIDDPCMVSRRCLEPRETFRTRKKIKDFHLRINERVLT